jgi:hypothetical protein
MCTAVCKASPNTINRKETIFMLLRNIKAEKTILDFNKNKDMLLGVWRIITLHFFQNPKKGNKPWI